MATNKTPGTPKKTYVNGKKIEIVCRLCAKTDTGCTNIFSKAGKEKNLPAVIEQLTGIVISAKDALPKTVCRSCQNQLLQYLNFKKKSLLVQATLSNITVKRCKELSPQPTKKRILSENPASKPSRSSDQHEKQVAKFIKKSPGEMTKSDTGQPSAQLLKKDDMVNAGLTSYDKTEVRLLLFTPVSPVFLIVIIDNLHATLTRNTHKKR